jgi:hypothetical protein
MTEERSSASGCANVCRSGRRRRLAPAGDGKPALCSLPPSMSHVTWPGEMTEMVQSKGILLPALDSGQWAHIYGVILVCSQPSLPNSEALFDCTVTIINV